MAQDAPTLSEPVRRLVIGGLVAGAVLLLGYIIAVATVGDGVRPGTTVAGIEIGGMSAQEATTTLQRELGGRAGRPIKVKAGETVLTVDPAEAGLSFDAAATVERASGRVLNPVALLGALTGSHEVEPVVTADETRLSDAIAQLADQVDTPAQEPELSMRGRQPVVREGSPGTVIDQAALAQQVRAALLERRTPIDAPLQDAEPTVAPEAVAEGKAAARRAVAAPVTVRAGEVTATLPPRAIARALSFTVEGGRFVPSLNGAVLHEAIADALAPVEDRGNDATFEIRKGRPVVVPSKIGRGVADDELASQVLGVLDEPAGSREVSVSIGTRPPKVSTEQAQALGVTELVSSFTQRFPYAAYRVQNIGQAAKYINGTLLLPGETFSMNDTVKERTEANGYTKGFIINPGGIFAEDFGGGVSTATTATWVAAFYAGLERVSTTAHSIYISRYKPGLEATVSWGNFDMKFRNDTPYAVYITATTTNTSVTVSMWSTKVYDSVKAEFGPRTNVRPFSTIYDASPTCLGQSGVEGFDINVDRVFVKGGAEVKRETIATHYKPTPTVICGEKKKDEFGGKKPGKGKPSASPSPSSSSSAAAGDAAAPAPGQ